MRATATSSAPCLPASGADTVRASPRTLSLRAGEVHSLDLTESERCSLHIREGLAWATLEGDATDHLLAANSRAVFIGPGRLVIEALDGDLLLQGALTDRKAW